MARVPHSPSSSTTSQNGRRTRSRISLDFPKNSSSGSAALPVPSKYPGPGTIALSSIKHTKLSEPSNHNGPTNHTISRGGKKARKAFNNALTNSLMNDSHVHQLVLLCQVNRKPLLDFARTLAQEKGFRDFVEWEDSEINRFLFGQIGRVAKESPALDAALGEYRISRAVRRNQRRNMNRELYGTKKNRDDPGHVDGASNVEAIESPELEPGELPVERQSVAIESPTLEPGELAS